MLIKFMSLVVAICAVELTVLGAQSPSDPLFLFISNDPIVVLIRLLLISGLVWIAFKERFTYQLSRLMTAAAGVLLVLIGIIGAISQAATNVLSVYLKALDFLLVLEVGVILLTAAVSFQAYQHALPLKNLRLNRFAKALTLVKPAAAELTTSSHSSRGSLSPKSS